eukprot:TRINITY_DN54927_c0_g1_i1.p1 TRINITY_DN54927_c0_g1~~TRINITY_DN54927_c0_g1_i1.p1  ORF type:complete len:472 (-),score=99.36 TRINITY_DN54927_c0_g1_i1:34-1449(-)
MGETAEHLKKIFSEFDTDQTFKIGRARLTAVLKILDPTLDLTALDGVFDYVDKDQSGDVDYNEFIDFLMDLKQEPGSSPASPTSQNARRALTTANLGRLCDIDRWKKALRGGGVWAFMIDEDASAVRQIVKKFPPFELMSSDGLTLAEEFILLWQDQDGDLHQYFYFGKDEPFHQSLYGACLLGLRSLDLLEFHERKCQYLGNYSIIETKGDRPKESKALRKVYDELAAADENVSLKEWFQNKTGKWGQDDTTKIIIHSLIDRGILELENWGDEYDETRCNVLKPEVRDAILARMRAVVEGTAATDTRSVALLALCRTADMTDATTGALIKNMFPDGDAEALGRRVQEIVLEHFPFNGVAQEEVSRMVRELPLTTQNYLGSEEFWADAEKKFNAIDKDGSQVLSASELAKAGDVILSKSFFEKLDVQPEGLETVIRMFDVEQKGMLDAKKFGAFYMWSQAMEILTLQRALA